MLQKLKNNKKFIISCKVLIYVSLALTLSVKMKWIENEMYETIGFWMLMAGASGVILTNTKQENKKLIPIAIAGIIGILLLLYYLVYVNPIQSKV